MDHERPHHRRGPLPGRAGRAGCRRPHRRADPHGRALAESLLDCGGFDPADILGRYLAWWREGAFDTGPVSDRALELVAAGMPVEEATAQVHREFGGKTAGCNPAHRSPPLAMLAAIADEDLAGCAMAEARLTHHDPLAGEVAAAVNGLCRALIRGGGWDGTPAAGWRLRRPGGAGQQRRLCAGRAAGGAALRRHVGLLHRGAGSVAGVRRAVQLLPGPRGGRRRCPLGRFRRPAAALAHVKILPRVRAAAEALASGWADYAR